MKKSTIKKIIKLIEIFIVTNTLCITTALLFYGFLVFMFSLFAISEHTQHFIFIFYSAVVIVAVGFINFFVFFDEFNGVER